MQSHIGNSYFLSAILGLVLSFTLALALAALFKYYSVKDPNVLKKRAAHSRPASRLGGVAVCLSILCVIIIQNHSWHIGIAISAVPIFCVGLLEDFDRPLPPKFRLAVGALSATMFIGFEGHLITYVGFEWGNIALSFTPIAILFTIFCVVALINAFNFIDGINGLASGKTMIVSFALMWLAATYKEPNLTLLGTAIFFASLGLFMLNYPQGRIFLGDAGAYTLGFLLAVSLITLQSKHAEISAWSILLIIFWPIADMGHSIFRRRLSGRRSDRPDKLHFHHVIMRSLIIASRGTMSKAWANPLATAIILPMAALPVVLGVVYNQNNGLCMALFFGFALFFACTHSWVINFMRRRNYVMGSVKKYSFTETN